jgi:pimeloyl-ACP methyl ester carboxylesterase
MPRTEGYVTMPDGVRLYYEIVGRGRPAVVVPNGIVLRRDFEGLAGSRAILFYDLRHRGRSDAVADVATLRRGIHNDVSDLEVVRGYFGIDAMSVIGFSYLGVMAVLYALAYPDGVARIVQIGPPEPSAGKAYPPHLTGEDDTKKDVFARLQELRGQREGMDPVEFCQRSWAILRRLYVVDPAYSHRADWGRCDLANERGAMRYWMESLLPSLQTLDLSREKLRGVRTPVLIIHGRRDRSSPYGGGREWAMLLGNARLVSVANAAHASWIEAPDLVLGSIETFLSGRWPDRALTVTSLQPAGSEA